MRTARCPARQESETKKYFMTIKVAARRIGVLIPSEARHSEETLGRCDESQALREVWRSEPRVAKILGYPAKAFRGMRNRSQRCSARRQISSSNEKPPFGSIYWVAAVQVQQCCERSGQSSFVVGTRSHLPFDVASFPFDNFKDQVTNNKVAPVHMVFPCSPFTSGEGRNNCVLRSFAQPWSVNDLSHYLQVKVAEGNRCARAVVDVLTCVCTTEFPTCLENPKTSCSVASS